jgi:hypothetical protein
MTGVDLIGSTARLNHLNSRSDRDSIPCFWAGYDRSLSCAVAKFALDWLGGRLWRRNHERRIGSR